MVLGIYSAIGKVGSMGTHNEKRALANVETFTSIQFVTVYVKYLVFSRKLTTPSQSIHFKILLSHQKHK